MRHVDAWLTRRGVVGAASRDRWLALVLAAVTAVAVTLLVLVAGEELHGATDGRVAAAGTLTVVQCLLLAGRRSHPRACLWLVSALQVLVVGLVPADVALRGPASLVAAYTVGTLLTGRAVVQVVGLAVAIETIGNLVVGAARDTVVEAVAASLSGLVVLGASALLGTYVGTRRHLVAVLRERAAEAEAAQEARVRTAIEAERTRMARELHDVAAHHLSGMVVQAAAVQRLVGRDTEAVREGVASIRDQGRRTLDDLRQLVGVLRDPDADTDGAPVPGLSRIDELVAAARAVSTDVELTVVGEPRDLPPLADAACYRIVQEALTNARQHAPGASVRVLVEHAAAVTLTIDNGPPSTPPVVAGGGAGLVGMRERAQLVGASLDVGPHEGGWRVRAVVSRREEDS